MLVGAHSAAHHRDLLPRRLRRRLQTALQTPLWPSGLTEWTLVPHLRSGRSAAHCTKTETAPPRRAQLTHGSYHLTEPLWARAIGFLDRSHLSSRSPNRRNSTKSSKLTAYEFEKLLCLIGDAIDPAPIDGRVWAIRHFTGRAARCARSPDRNLCEFIIGPEGHRLWVCSPKSRITISWSPCVSLRRGFGYFGAVKFCIGRILRQRDSTTARSRRWSVCSLWQRRQALMLHLWAGIGQPLNPGI